MPRQIPLTPPLDRAAFSVARARQLGFSRARMRNRALERPFHGVRAHPGVASSLGAFVPRLRPREWFSHESAARLWHVPLPPPVARSHIVHVTIAAPGAASRARGVQGHQSSGANPPVVRRHGLPCSDAAATWLSLATVLSLPELVAAGDHFVLDPEVLDPDDPRPYVTLDDLRRRTVRHHGSGVANARRAIRLVRQGAESRPESLLRLLIRDARLPEPEVNPIIHDSTGRRIGRADLVYRQYRVIVEYDGDQHRTEKAQYRKDVKRWQRFMLDGWDVRRIHHDDLFERPAATQLEIVEALTRGGWVRASESAQRHRKAPP